MKNIFSQLLSLALFLTALLATEVTYTHESNASSLNKIGLKPFTSDGCSMFFDGTPKQPKLWCKCCVEHDLSYWQGGTEQQRLSADQQFRKCVYQQTNNKKLANVMFHGVRQGGKPSLPTWYRWGYGWLTQGWKTGWKNERLYTPISEKEKSFIAEYIRTSNDYHKQLSLRCDN